ncbi:hypothetical protein NX059_003960 [Plenodomus lindquistii]|nr:hypothetical protein NX059_003960 [Plenodomus lindquistii]
MSGYTRYHVLGALVAGIALSAAYQQWTRSQILKHDNTENLLKQQHRLLSKLAKINDLDALKKSLSEIETEFQRGAGSIREGIEGCIGGTPLIKIKSLSEFTGCEILAKAEVEPPCLHGQTSANVA